MTHSKLVPAALMFLLAVTATAGDALAQKKEKVKKPKPVMCAIIQVGTEYQVVAKAEIAAMKKRLVQQHKQALADHKAAKAEAKKNKEKFTIKPPKAQKLKVVKASIEQSKAEAAVAKLRERDAKKAAPKEKRQKKKTKK